MVPLIEFCSISYLNDFPSLCDKSNSYPIINVNVRYRSPQSPPSAKNQETGKPV